MGRSTVYNLITTPEKLEECNKNNVELGNDFLDYLKSIDRSDGTIKQYKADLNILWVWNLDFNNNKDFVKITKREFSKFQSHALNEWGWSSGRIRRVKSTISSLSNYIENILDDEEEFEGYRSIVRKIENPVNQTVREKSVFTKEELDSLLSYLTDKGEYLKACVVALAMFSGRRKSELLRFKVSYFSDENIMFNGAMWKTDEKVKTKGRGKNGKMLNLYVLRNDFLPYYNNWMKYREENGIASEWLFPKKNSDEPIETSTLDFWVSEFSEYLKKPFYYHSCRHFYTTRLAESNIPSSVIQEIIGWSSADMVNLYTDTSADDSIGRYFDENGFKDVQSSSLLDL